MTGGIRQRGVIRFFGAIGGSTAIEFALIAPVIISLFFGMFEFARAIWTQSVLDYAVEEAARCASVNTGTCGTNGATQNYAATSTGALALPANIFTSSSPAGCSHQVTASYPFHFVLSIFNYNITLTSQACSP
jgi:Flp pilus assembly protein TadG